MRRPREPAPGECCGSGCSRCVWDVYYDEVARYEQQQCSSLDEDSCNAFSSSSTSDDEQLDYVGSVVLKIHDGRNEALLDSFENHAPANFAPLFASDIALKTNSGDDFIKVVACKVPKHFPAPVPGDVVELVVPNTTVVEEEDLVGKICEKLGLAPESLCTLTKSPFVPEGHFPPWLPQRQALTIRSLLTYYADITSSSFLLHSSLYQGLLRVHANQRKDVDSNTDKRSVDILRECAGPAASAIFRSVNNEGRPLCFPNLLDILEAFPFCKIPLERLLEISGPVRARKYSVAGYSAGNDFHTIDLCVRPVMANRTTNLVQTPAAPDTAIRLATLLNDVRIRRSPNSQFLGHTSWPLTHSTFSSNQCATLSKPQGQCIPIGFVGVSSFGTTKFAQHLSSAVQSMSQTTEFKTPSLFLIGSGSGIGPMMAAVQQLVKFRRSFALSCPFPVWVWYGARTWSDLVYHNDLQSALKCGALSDYSYSISRPDIDSPKDRYVTDILQRNAHHVRESLLEGSGKLFVCGPGEMMKSTKQALQNSILSEADDDESVREQRIAKLELHGSIAFDVWSTISPF